MKKSIAALISPSKNNYANMFFMGLITAFLIFLPFIIYDHGLFLYYGDFDVQQIPFYRLAHDSIRSGDVLWNWNTDLGVNFMGSYSFYLLGSPFFWITLLFPSSFVPYLMAPLLMLKFALTAVTGYAYINRFTKTSSMAMLGGLLYAFSGFNVYNIFFNHFNEVVLIFPLLLIALEELVINDRRGGFALAVALCATVNYYFFFGQVIFVVIYFFIRMTSKDFRPTFKKFCFIFLEAVMGLLISAVLLIPSLLAIMNNPRTSDILLGYDMLFYGSEQRYGLIFSSLFFPPDIPARPNFFPNSNSKWSSVSLFLPMISTVGVFAFFKGAKRHWAKLLLSICAIIALVPILNSAFSAFNYSYYARWFYMPLLIMSMISCKAVEGPRRHLRFGIISTAAVTFAFTIIGVLPKKVDGEIKFFSMPEYPERFWGYVAIAFIGILITIMLYNLTINHKYFIKAALVGVMVVSCVYSVFMIYLGKLSGEGYETVAEKAIVGRERLDLPDDQFYRIDTYDELDNLGMHLNLPTINAFHSVVPPSIMDYYESIGEERGVASRPKPEFLGVRALTSVRYSFIKETKPESTPMAGFEYYDTQNGYRIYENKYFVPMGFTYDYLLTQHQFDNITGEYRDRVLLKGLLLENDDHDKYSAYLPTLPDKQAEDFVLSAQDDYFDSCTDLIRNTASEFKIDNKGFTAKITSKQKNLFFVSVPFDEGWSATVNNIPVDISRANNGFMAVPIPEGGSVVRFEYSTPGFLLGIIVTIITIAAFIAYMWLIKKYQKKHDYNRFIYLTDNLYNKIPAHEAYIDKNIRTKKNATESSAEQQNKNEP